MNYIWDLLIKAEQLGREKPSIQFKLAEICSPYMELSPEVINSAEIDHEIEINPYYRYYEIFKELFPVDYFEDQEIRHTLLDLVLHFLAEIDKVEGMNRREFYIRFVLQDIESGLFGSTVQRNMNLLNDKEKELVGHNLLRLYETGEDVYFFKDTVRKICKGSLIYAKCEKQDELLIYIGQKENEWLRSKIQLIQDLFLPVRFKTELYWEKHFGMIEVDQTMRIDHIAMY